MPCWSQLGPWRPPETPATATGFITYPFRAEVFASDMADVFASQDFISAMKIGYRLLAAMTELVIWEQGSDEGQAPYSGETWLHGQIIEQMQPLLCHESWYVCCAARTQR